MTREEKQEAIAILVALTCLLIGTLIGGTLGRSELDGIKYEYEQLLEDYNALQDRNWNLQQQILKLEEQ